MPSQTRLDHDRGAGDPVEESTVEDLVRRAVRATYAPGRLEQDVDYVDAHYEQRHGDTHCLRVRAPDHELLAFERWLVVTLDDRRVHLCGAGRSGPTEFYVRARLDGPTPR
ncbi:MAG: hypothetical protein ABEJ92_03550 [Halobacteriales archaeon]